MKIGIIADTHFGARSDSPHHLVHMVRYFRDQFFPEIERRGVRAVVHLGDLVDRRKYVNFKTAETLRREFLEPLADKRIRTEIICGNHDVSFKNTNETNALTELVGERYEGVRVHTGPDTVDVGGLDICLVPWICQANERETMDEISSTSAPYCMGHLELAGFKMYRSSQDSHGLDPSVFKRFDAVLSGHYHHRSTRGNVLYVGAPYEMTWADHDDERGFHVLDTETLDLEYVRNTVPLHAKVHYSDEVRDDTGSLAGRIVKVIVSSREDGRAFDEFMRGIESQSPADVQVVEDNLRLDLEPTEDDPEMEGSEDTSSILKRAVDDLDQEDVDKASLGRLLMDVYQEAVNRR